MGSLFRYLAETCGDGSTGSIEKRIVQGIQTMKNIYQRSVISSYFILNNTFDTKILYVPLKVESRSPLIFKINRMPLMSFFFVFDY